MTNTEAIWLTQIDFISIARQLGYGLSASGDITYLLNVEDNRHYSLVFHRIDFSGGSTIGISRESFLEADFSQAFPGSYKFGLGRRRFLQRCQDYLRQQDAAITP